MIKRFALVAAVSALGLASPASAAYVFQLSQDGEDGVYSFSIEDPADLIENTAGTVSYAVQVSFASSTSLGAAIPETAIFGTTAAPYQFSFGRGSTPLASANQFFTGATDNPTGFTLGTFGLNADDESRYSLTITSDATPPVPEAATWAMMLLGFSGMGYALRRRSNVSARVRFS